MPDSQIYGLNAVLEALASGAELSEIRLAVGLNQATRRQIEDLARQRGISVLKSQRKDLDRLTRGAVHQGVVAVWGAPATVELDDLAALEPAPGQRLVLLCLDEIQDPRNLGALARSALAFGAAGLVLPERRSAGLTPAAIKASAGALCRLPVARQTNLGRALDRLKELGFWVTGAALQGGQPPWGFDPGERVALVLGSEGSGLRPGIVAKLDYTVCIPMPGPAESLNVSVAGALLLYEWLARPRTDRPES